VAEAHDLLVEVGTEELPFSELHTLGAGFAEQVHTRLAAALGADRPCGPVEWYATPRRLAVSVSAVPSVQPDRLVEHRGPPFATAFDAAGEPTRAATGFARRHGVAVGDLEQRATGNAVYLFHTEQRPGSATAELLPELADAAARAIPARKRMRWGVSGVTFPRPVHWSVLLYGETHLAAHILGVRTGRATRGHRFHHPGALELRRPGDYAARLLDPGWVVADATRRAAQIREQVAAAAAGVDGEAELDPALVDDVTALVEWPVALAGRFDRRFLDVPAEALVAVMKDHQKAFPVRDADGALLPAFVAVSNIASADPAVVRHGHERVIAPRLADAEFFWQQDRRQPLGARLEGLAAMVFQHQLGTLADRTQRIAALAPALATRLNADRRAAETAGQLAKCDLLTEMVGEFPELQGLMGGYYAAAEGYAAPVARAIADHYRPAFAGDNLPRTREGRALALADRLDALVGGFAIGQGPTGDKDPFALRRAALGTLRILVESGHDIDLEAALADAAAGYAAGMDAPAAVAPVFDFMTERLRVYYTGAGFARDRVDAVLAQRPTRPLDADARLRAVEAFAGRAEASALTEANKRLRNILRKAGESGDAGASPPDSALLADAAERDLAGAVAGLGEAIEPLLAARDYTGALAELAALAGPLDRFFNGVRVMADDAALRANRIALLARARQLFLRVADLSQLQSH